MVEDVSSLEQKQTGRLSAYEQLFQTAIGPTYFFY